MNMPLWLVIWLVAIEAIIVTVLVPGDWTARVIAEESELLKARLGAQEHRWVHDKASYWFTTTLMDSGVYDAVRNHILPTAAEKQASRGIENMGDFWFTWVEERLQATVNAYYHVLARFALLYTWAPYFLILLVPAVFDGIMTWRIKRTNFDYASPLLHQYSTLGIVYILVFLIALFLAPIVLDPMLIPAAIMLMCVMVGLMMGNLQKRL
ncbi:MAG: DUF4400 domain-containing protein [Cellvibrionaceae bacterium]|nr:DUF4400 domain-containing protein [Cellvibrionaceae bacterium]